MRKLQVRLSGVLGDQEDFADLIGTSGELTLGDRNVYTPKERGDWLTLAVGRVTEAEGKIRVRTKLGNTFIFTVVG